jgi:hypothetical protein
MLAMPRATLLVSFIAAAAVACSSSTTTTTTGPDTTSDDPVVAAGECKVPGYDCTRAGAPCSSKCYATDAKKDAYVTFVVDGRTLDSRAVPYDPVTSGDRTLRYGCGLFTASDGTQGLELLYRKNEVGAAFTDDTTIRIDGFMGPGRYQASVRYIPDDAAQAAGTIYAKKSGCAVDVAAGDQGGVAATISCSAVPAKDGTTVSITGEARCGGTALDALLSQLP